MRRSTYLRLLAVSLLAALLLSGVSIFLLSRLFDLAARDHREAFLVFMAQSLENQIRGKSWAELQEQKIQLPFGVRRFDPGGGASVHSPLEGPGFFGPPPSRYDESPFPPPGPPMFGVGGPGPEGPGDHEFKGHFQPPPPPGFPSRSVFWVVSEGGQVLSRNDDPLPEEWADLKKGGAVHQVEADEDFFRMHPNFYLIRLDHEPPLYILSRERRPFWGSPLFYSQATITFTTVAAALFMALSIVAFYLRRKSAEARLVLSLMEKGDLKARFPIRRIDEFGGLMLDFNRMADEIERLVSRVRTTESARRDLLQELGHDLRTPLTSLQTSFENLKFHGDKMTEKDRREVLEMITGEIDYFKDLLEKILTLGTLDEPSYRGASEAIDLKALIEEELRQRQGTGGNLTWTLTADAGSFSLLGDVHLIRRLFRNAFDNAGRFAKTHVEVAMAKPDAFIEVRVRDDGRGLSETDLGLFGHRRDQRARLQRMGSHLSLGLGSVIMKTVAELHGGSLEIKNRVDQNEIRGAEVIIRLPNRPNSSR